MLNLKNIKKDYYTASETVHALGGVNIAFRAKEFVSILGPSGCGKTTLLNIIGGLDHYTDGDLVIAGKSTKSFTDRDWDVYRNHRIGFIFQSYNLIPHQTILGNVELALTIAGISREERIRRAKVALDRVGLKGKYYQRPNQLSGGQCQRVAIARALVNDPEILLADEPTGALDTVTSVQIMDLIKEISGERLVIMVTHNPELAERYSSRIIRLRDGEVLEDTNPFTEEEEASEIAAANAAEAEGSAAAPAEGKERAKMSLATAFMLSARNLISKRGRTVMVGIAGSVGIIGIALVLAFSAGIKGYVASMQDDMLSGNPITIQETAIDFDSLSDIASTEEKIEIVKQPNRAYINSIVSYYASMDRTTQNMLTQNVITREYVDYVKAMPQEYYAAMTLDYGYDLSCNLYVDFTADGETRKLSLEAVTKIYTDILEELDQKQFASMVPSMAPSMKQAPAKNGADGKTDTAYILSQYDVYGNIAEKENELMLVLSSRDELSDLLLARFGFFTQNEFIAIVNKALKQDDEKDRALFREYFTFDELVGKTMTYYPNDVAYSVLGNEIIHNPEADGFEEEGTQLKIVGILMPKETISYGCLSSGLYYTEKFAKRFLSDGEGSELVSTLAKIKSGEKKNLFNSYSIRYKNLKYSFEGESKNIESSTVSFSSSYGRYATIMNMMEQYADQMGAGDQMGKYFGQTDELDSLIRSLGGNDVASAITIYPITFDSKDLVTDYLDGWNADEKNNKVTYSDTLALVINLINTMIDIVSYALIAFTSVSLVVSTVMIGIITYVSVVERIKEIGVIRALGGRKRDVSHLFNAETFIIGGLAGLIGIGVTYLVSAIVNVILYGVTGIPNLAALPFYQAVELVILSIGLTLISGLIPAASAAKKDPVVALRTE